MAYTIYRNHKTDSRLITPDYVDYENYVVMIIPMGIVTRTKKLIFRSRGYNTIFMLNSVEHEIDADNYKKNQEIHQFSGSNKQRMLFFLLINVEMPTTVSITTFMSRKKIMLS